MSANLQIVNKLFQILKTDFAGKDLIAPEKLSEDAAAELADSLDKATSPLAAWQTLEHFCLSLSHAPIHIVPSLTNKDVPAFSRGIRLRRADDTLVVQPGTYDSRFPLGSRVLQMSRKSIPDILAEEPVLFDPAYPNHEDWETYTKLAHGITVSQASPRPVHLLFKRFPLEDIPAAPKNSFEEVSEGAVAIRFTDLSDPVSLLVILEEHKEEIASADYLILDLRKASEGFEEIFFPFLAYCFDEDVSPAKLWNADSYQFNYTEANEAQLKETYLSMMAECTEEALALVPRLLADLKAKKGKGMLPETDDCAPDWDEPIESKHFKGQVLILTDYTTRGCIENCVAMAKKADRVTVLGRPTFGDKGWYNPTTQVLCPDYSVEYPAGVSEAFLQGDYSALGGVKPDIEFPYDPMIAETYEFFLDAFKKEKQA